MKYIVIILSVSGLFAFANSPDVAKAYIEQLYDNEHQDSHELFIFSIDNGLGNVFVVLVGLTYFPFLYRGRLSKVVFLFLQLKSPFLFLLLLHFYF